MTIDGEAAREIEWAIVGSPACPTLEYGGLLLNLPNNPVSPAPSYFRDEDLVVYAGRMPLDDLKEDRKYMGNLISGSDLESRMHVACRKYFRILKRQRLQLTDTGFNCLRDEYKSCQGDIDWRNLEFDVFNGQAYLKDQRGKRTSKTLGCVVYMRHLYDTCPGFLHVFAMGGNETLIFAHLLRTNPRLNEELTSLLADGADGFMLVELDWGAIPTDAYDLSFCQRWGATVSTQVPR